MTYHILKHAGLDVGLAGNVGQSLAAQVAKQAHQVYVVELSSFQLDGMYTFRSDVAVLTNITPDHLDRYGYQFENYVNSKFRILNNMKSTDFFIYQEDCSVVREKLLNMEVIPQVAGFTYGEKATCSDTTSGAWMEGDVLAVRLKGQEYRIDKKQITIQGRHNVYNAMAAILVSLQMGIEANQITEALQTFPQVEHRLETVREKNGVTYINDPKRRMWIQLGKRWIV